MELLSQITISRPEGDASIQLLYGDLTAIPSELAVDILAVSAFRGDYLPVPDTLIGALYRAGLSVAEPGHSQRYGPAESAKLLAF